MASLTEPRTFHLFPKLPTELQFRIWAKAIEQEGPHIVELQLCKDDHSMGKCYVETHLPHDQDGCCFHDRNPFKENSPIHCPCIKSHEIRKRRPFLCQKHHDEVDRKRRVFLGLSCPSCQNYTRLHSNTKGHKRQTETHVCPSPYSKSLSLLQTCVQSRYEIQRLGSLQWTQEPGHEFNKTCWNHPIWFNFELDTLAISRELLFQCVLLKSGSLRGCERVSSLILTRPEYPGYICVDDEETFENTYKDFDVEVEDFTSMLDTFPNAESLVVAQFEAGYDNGPLRLCDLSRALIQDSQEKKYETLFAVLVEQVNWCRKLANQKLLKHSGLKCIQRSPHWKSGANADTWEAKENDFDTFHGAWLHPSSLASLRSYLQKQNVKQEHMELHSRELETLCEGWEKKIDEVADWREVVNGFWYDQTPGFW